MKNILCFLVFVFLLTPVGCKYGPPVKVVGPPVYKNNIPSHTFYETLAMRTSEMAPEGIIPSDPEKALQVAMDEIERRGIKVYPKAEGYEQWEKFTTTFPTVIFTATDWEMKSTSVKAELMWHELVHVREYEKHTPLNMGLMYWMAEGRWAMEVQAYRESFRVRRIFGESEKSIREGMPSRAEMLYESYELGSMPREYAVDKAIEIWMLDSLNP